MERKVVNKRGLSWQSALALATATDRKRGKRKALHSDLQFFGPSNELQVVQFELRSEEKRRARKEKAAMEKSAAKTRKARAKFKRKDARERAIMEGKDVSFPYSFEFRTRFGVFRIEESEGTFCSKASAIQNCQARLRKWWKKRSGGCSLAKSLSIIGRKSVDDNGIALWELRVRDNSTARQFAEGPLLSPKRPDIGERKDTFKETYLVRSK